MESDGSSHKRKFDRFLEAYIEGEVRQKSNEWQERLGVQEQRIKALESDNLALKKQLDAFQDTPDSLQAKIIGLWHDNALLRKAKDVLEARCQRYNDIAMQWRSQLQQIGGSRKYVRTYQSGSKVMPNCPSDDVLTENSTSNTGFPLLVPEDPTSTPTAALHYPEAYDLQDEEAAQQSSPQTEEHHSTEEVHISKTGGESSNQFGDVDAHKFANLSSLRHAETSSVQGSKNPSNRQPEPPCQSPQLSSNRSSDSPVFLSARSLKRKRANTPPTTKSQHHDSDAGDKGEAIKTESIKSSPMAAVPTRVLAGLHESLDLDDIGSHLRTPKKRRKFQRKKKRLSGISVAEDQTFDEGSTNAKLRYPSNTTVYEQENSTSLQSDDDDIAKSRLLSSSENLGTTAPQALRAERKASLLAAQNSYNERAHHALHAHSMSSSVNHLSAATNEQDGVVLSSGPAESPKVTNLSPLPLHHRDPNIVMPRSSESRKIHPPLQAARSETGVYKRKGSAAFIPILAEDGDMFEDRLQGKVRSTEKGGKAADKSSLDRLQSLLTVPAPERAILEASRLERNVQGAVQTPITKGVPEENRSTDFKALRDIIHESRPKHSLYDQAFQSNRRTSLHSKPGGSTESSAERKASLTPLRLRNLDSLRLTDFKLNPNHISNLEEQSISNLCGRAGSCLSCHTEPSCYHCKDIASFAEISGYIPAPVTKGLFEGSQKTTTDINSKLEAQKRLVEDRDDGEEEDDEDEDAIAITMTQEERLKKEKEENQILRSFLPPSQPLPSLDDPNRTILLRQARTRLFASHFGKHRHPSAIRDPTTPSIASGASRRRQHQQQQQRNDKDREGQYGRAVTPPGFWNTEMQSTQEERQNRLLSAKMERERVKERWSEAMKNTPPSAATTAAAVRKCGTRPGVSEGIVGGGEGIWKFADE